MTPIFYGLKMLLNSFAFSILLFILGCLRTSESSKQVISHPGSICAFVSFEFHHSNAMQMLRSLNRSSIRFVPVLPFLGRAETKIGSFIIY